jgi:hypothetical protein
MPIYYKLMPNIYTTKRNRVPTSRTTDPTLWFSSIFYCPRTNLYVFYFLCCSYIRDIIIWYRLDPFVFEYLNITSNIHVIWNTCQHSIYFSSFIASLVFESFRFISSMQIPRWSIFFTWGNIFVYLNISLFL